MIAARSQTDVNTEISKPVMIIDQDNIPHGFCVSKCEIIKETNIKLIKIRT